MGSPAAKAFHSQPQDNFKGSILWSILVHVVLFLALFGVGRLSGFIPAQPTTESTLPIQELTPEGQPVPLEVGGDEVEVMPLAFSGRSLEKPHVETAEEKSAAEVKKIQTLSEQMSKLSNLRLGMGGDAKKGKAPPVDAKNIDQALSKVRKSIIGTREGISGAARVAKLQMSASNSVSKTIGPADEAKVREIFDSLQSKFSAAYDSALKVDPNLTLVLTYEGTVAANGFLSKLKFKPSGQYTPQGLEVIQQQMNSVLSKAYLGKNLSGVIIRGERLFVQ